MKKAMSLVLTVMFVIFFSAHAFADSTVSDRTFAEVEKQVEKTNIEISNLISKAVGDADKKIQDYLTKFKEIEMGKKLADCDNQMQTLQNNLNSCTDEKKKQDILEKIIRLQESIEALEAKIEYKTNILGNELSQLTIELASIDADSKNYNKIQGKIERVLDKIENKSEKLEELTQNLESRINKIIADLIDITNEESKKMVEDAEKHGVFVECELIEVELGNQTILVDPLRIRRY